MQHVCNLYISMFQRNWNLRICSLSHQKKPTFRRTDEIFWVLTRATLKGHLWCLEKKSDENNLKRDGPGGDIENLLVEEKIQSVRANFKHNLKWCHCEWWFRKRILSKWSDISGLWVIGVYRNLSRTALDVSIEGIAWDANMTGPTIWINNSQALLWKHPHHWSWYFFSA